MVVCVLVLGGRVLYSNFRNFFVIEDVYFNHRNVYSGV